MNDEATKRCVQIVARDLDKLPLKVSARCGVCDRNPDRMNSAIAECSHVDCPHRRRAWSDGVATVTLPSTDADLLEQRRFESLGIERIPMDLKRHER